MKLGFFTACLPDMSLEDIETWAREHGYDALEIAAWPAVGDRPNTVAHIQAAGMTTAAAKQIASRLAARGLTASSLGFYENHLHPDPTVRSVVREHLLACVDAAAMLGCATVGTFIGRDPSRTVADNLALAEEIFPPIVEHADAAGVKIVIENCVMEGWHPDGYPGNLAYSPELWEWMFSLGLYLNYDPSHLLWMGIDPVDAARPYVHHIAHVQAKDVQVFPERRNRYGYPGRIIGREPWESGWWRYRVPGLGDVDWARVIDMLYEGGYDGVISVEHEDPIWGGTEDRIKTGLVIAYNTLRQLVVV